MTARLILLPDTAAALDRLNDLRDGQRKLRDAERTGDTDALFFLREWYAEQAVAFVDAILAGHTYTDDTDDPRVAALEARSDALAQAVWDISDEAFLCGVSGDSSDRIREIEQRVRELTGDTPPAQETPE